MSTVKMTQLADLAKELNGKLWQKADKTRIYVNGGNNYHYRGKWYYEIYEDGSYESKAWLEDGYNNKKREDYVAKYLREMDESMVQAIAELNTTSNANSSGDENTSDRTRNIRILKLKYKYQ